ncbi:hypothetical protein EMIHUDRAFT_215100 [Emiliania huxleyi CCMP1516]|uniref:XPG N-terminal domain-containing protein n=2 Tax=Emiliania huxleyi TaxID=2903 RepID=A0A0D3IHX3_EMIH1|nr:hypothetical protein EMIHUDRAFT_215100 [Emiliania huxleyi CCMP1516]EOD10858.1 hypothetical protein EMIHUDRAFT_215100 [Emiliania huxleyi CCMP1516]|eukprot:XP_005763287.1 hypothetical protein EMIHUDRAFT_215100 [Emiliania huxleyi CCMP1516]
MGVTGFSALLKHAAVPTPLTQFAGKRLAVDGNVWLHRGTYSCALQLVSGEATSGHIRYCRKLAELLVSANCRVLVVFDGRPLPGGRRGGRADAPTVARGWMHQAHALPRVLFKLDRVNGLAMLVERTN